MKGRRQPEVAQPDRQPGKPRHTSTSTSNGKGYRLARFWLWVLMMSVRGGAKNPGPTIAVMNPTGVMGKVGMLQAVNADIAAISETHLSAEGIQQFRKELHFHGGGSKLSHGHPAPARSNTVGAIGGRPKGVGFVSHYPMRAHQPLWDQSVQQEARLQVTSFHIGNQWITGGLAYGYAELPQTIGTKQLTNGLIRRLSEAVVHNCKGKRFLAGDWNQPLDDIEFLKEWESLGWVEAQQWAMAKYQQVPMATCKRSTIRDYLMLSPELVADLEEVEVSWEWFSDHAVLRAKFREFANPTRVPVWRKPRPIEWSSKPVRPNIPPRQDNQTGTERYKAIWEAVEEAQSHQRTSKGHEGLQQAQRGRAGTMEVTWVTPDTVPLKQARAGDFQSQMAGGNQTHTRWAKQARRLEHLARALNKAGREGVTDQHCRDLWRAVTKAPGFGGNFCSWWNRKEKHFASTPATIGFGMPNGAQVLSIFEEMAIEVRLMENSIGKARREAAAMRRVQTPHLVFKDIQAEAAAPMSTLVKEEIFVVEEMSPDGMRMKIDRPNMVSPNKPVFIQGIAVQAKWDDSHFHFSSPVHIQVGQKISQQEFIGDLGDMFKQFETEWQPRWNRHRERIPSTWQTLIDFACRQLPSPQGVFPPITPEVWAQTLRKKKKRSATGPDGISRTNLMSLAPEATEAILALLEAAEKGEEWPSQLATGMINSLEKCPEAAMVTQYRPITILPVAYRTWSSIRAKQSLQHISQLAPQGLLGNMPSKTTSQAWHQMQQMIEKVQLDEEELAGYAVDLVKCFNLLPRTPLEAVARHIGLPPGVVTGWHNFIGQLERRFVVRGCTGPPHRGVTGYPEGCAMSVVAMAVTNLVCHRWMELMQPAVKVLSYVDDWQALANQASEVQAAFAEIQSFCKLLDIDIDGRKSFCWSTAADGRKVLREGHEVKHNCRELGGHMNFTRFKTNYTVIERMQKVQQCWGKLARSSASYAQKKQAVRQGIWPKALHGGAIVSIGAIHYEHLRTGMMRGLNVATKGANPCVQWSLVERPHYDPEYCTLWESVVHYRRYGNPDLMHPVLNQLAQGLAKASPGPSATLLQRLHQIGWHWVGDGHCLDQAGLPIDLYGACHVEVKQRLCLAWQMYAASKVSHRTTFDGLAHADFDLTTAKLSSIEHPRHGLLRCALNGTQFTADALIHSGKVAHTGCVYCGEEDNQVHRHWHCKAFERFRTKILQTVETTPMPLSKAFYNHGWVPKSPAWWKFKEALFSIPDTHHLFQLEPRQFQAIRAQAAIHLFTDGSCANPRMPSERIATWGVCVAEPDAENFWPIAMGGIPGWVQTVGRGEITVVISALEFTVAVSRPTWLWIDNEEVLTRVRMTPDELRGCQHLSNYDLWREVARLLEAVGENFMGALKVDSHQKEEDGNTWVDRWVIRGNAVADTIAAQAQQTLPVTVLTHWTTLVKHQQFLQTLRDQAHELYISIGEYIIGRNQRNSRMDELPASEVTRGVQEATIQWPYFLGMTSEGIPPELHCEGADQIFAWAASHAEDGEVRAVSWHQVFVDFLLRVGKVGVVRRQKMWHAQTLPGPTLDFLSCSRGLSRYVQAVAEELGTPIQIVHRRPVSNLLFFWAGCVFVSWSDERYDAVERYFLEFGRPPFRKVHGLNTLPVVARGA